MNKIIIAFAFSICIINSVFCSETERRKPVFHYPGYTIEYLDNGYKIYKGDPAFSSNLIYTIIFEGENYSIFKGSSDFSLNLIYAVETDNKGYRIYKGDPDFSSNLIYALEYTDKGYKIYKGDPTFLSNLAYTVEYTAEYYKVYKGDSFSSNLIYYVSREALKFFESHNTRRKEKQLFDQLLFQPSLFEENKRSDNLSDSIILSLIDSLLNR